jgi:hypothetical protein
MREYVAEPWRAIFEHNQLRTFDDFWRREITWFEKPNFRRGGWSGVARLVLKKSGGGNVDVFIKRQEDHVTRTWRHPFRGTPTLRREYENLRRFEAARLPVPGLLYFGEDQVAGHQRAVLVTEALAGYHSLEELSGEWMTRGWPSMATRRSLITGIAKVIARMHAHRFQHNCLYAKHVFVKQGNSGELEVRLIDLEKAKRRCSRRRAVHRDLDTLHRHTAGWRLTDRVRFLSAYLEGSNGSTRKRLWKVLVQLSRKKSD